jgi:MurNAc alpha-1-phosphate uridylyltransferase
VLNLPQGATGRDHTFSTIALYKKAFFADCGLPSGNPQGVALALAPLLRAAMDRGQVTGEVYSGPWTDVGTPERLAQLNHG